jgi:hypothetical protein
MSQEFLMNLRAGIYEMASYTFSAPEIDLAIISLDSSTIYSPFANNLISSGYNPITLDDIGEEPSMEGTDVFSVGYPASIAVLGQLPLHPISKIWRSPYISLPIIAFGKVSMKHNLLPYFWCDISIYPGNSGGPIIENEKIVGIVSQQPQIPSDIYHGQTQEKTPFIAMTRIPFGKIIKAKFIKAILEEQIQKDARQGKLR